jgi:hypothetical protein
MQTGRATVPRVVIALTPGWLSQPGDYSVAAAEALVAAFTARLRRTIDLDTIPIDLDTIRSEFAGVVHEAFQPAHVWVWLPGAESHTAVLAPARVGADQPDT